MCLCLYFPQTAHNEGFVPLTSPCSVLERIVNERTFFFVAKDGVTIGVTNFIMIIIIVVIIIIIIKIIIIIIIIIIEIIIIIMVLVRS